MSTHAHALQHAGADALWTSGVDVLLVEDSAADAELIAGMLEDELPGCSVVVATSIAAALPLLRGTIDVVITDLSLPDAMDLEALTSIRTVRPDVAVLVMTGRNDRELALLALAEGADDYLVKGSHDARGVATATLYAVQRRRVKETVDRYQRLSMSLLDAMDSITCAVDRDGVIIAVNRAWRAVADTAAGADARTGVGMNYFDACRAAIDGGSPDAVAVTAGLQEVLSGAVDRFEHTYACPSPEGELWYSVRINPLPEAAGAVLAHVDISNAKRAELALSHRSLHDPLTDLPNRTLLNDRLDQALAMAAREDRAVAVAFVDLDQFKQINDSLGHRVGDELLQAIGGRLVGQVRPGDTVARIAGDEFVVLWPGVDGELEVRALAARLLSVFDAPFALSDMTLSATGGVGVALSSGDESAEELLMAADAAMDVSKQQGRAGLTFFTDDLREAADQRVRLEQELREALVRGEFVLHYQPVVDLRDRVSQGVEALVRWQHPDGMRMPDAFIPLAEATGLIVPLGAWVVREACRQAAEWESEGLDLTMAVNLSARQASHPSMMDTLEDALAASGLAPDRLLVEITESAVMDDAETALAALTRIADRGIRIAIDDFGTGYSSLVYLKRYPIDALKVDRSFVDGMGRNPDDDAIVASIINLARAVGAECIAEGVETHEQLDALRGLGCTLAQGYLFSRPVPAAMIPSVVTAFVT